MLEPIALADNTTSKKVLVISYYWPPAGGSGVQRWVKFAKYLPESGWQPIVYTPSNPEYPSIDQSLVFEVDSIPTITHPIFEPYAFYRKFTGHKGSVGAGFVSESEKVGLAQKIAIWIRGNLFIPDARKFFVATSISRLSKFLKDNPVDAIVSTGPPHSMHLIAQELSKRFHIPWLADFRDPWTKVYYFNDLNPSKWARKRQERLERSVLASANEVVVVTKGTAKEMDTIVARNYHVITNGYDHEDFPNLSQVQETKNDKPFIISYAGTLLPSQFIPEFWKSLAHLKSQFALEIHFYGRIDVSTTNFISEVNLDSHCTFHGYIPHDEIVDRISKSNCNLLILPNLPESEILIPGKLFEYLASRRPIFAIGTPQSEISQLITTHNAGVYHHFDDSQGISNSLTSLLTRNHDHFSFDLVESFSRKNLTRKLVTLLEQMTSSIKI